MYPPSAQYTSLPTDPERENEAQHPYSHHLRMRLGSLRRRKFVRPAIVASGIILFLFIFRQLYEPQSDVPLPVEEPVKWKEGDFTFSDSPRPKYMDTPSSKPLVIRLAIVSRVDEFVTRQTLRDTMLSGISKKDVRIDYRFFVGRLKPGDVRNTWSMWWDLFLERWYQGDVVTLWDLNDVKERLSEKRYRALQWTNSVSPQRYDYSMTLDSDTFCRFSALARRLKHNHPDLKPTTQPILIARMNTHLVYFENTVPDGNPNDEEEDYHVKGPWYQFPIGFGYMISSNLTRTLLSANPPLPHHVNFPSDDVMIGSWISGLKLMHDPTAEFISVLPPPTLSTNAPSNNRTYYPPDTRVYPRPYLPYRIDTNMVDDTKGWHDFRGKGNDDAPVGWDSVCIHRMSIGQIRLFREMEEVRTEWGG